MRSEVIQTERIESNLATRAIAEASRFCLRLIAGLIPVALGWIAFSSLVVPAVIETAYRGESLSFLNSIISGQAVHSVGYYLATWQMISWRVLGLLFVVGLIPLPLVTTGPDVQIYLEARYQDTLSLAPGIMNTVLALFGFTLVFCLYHLYPIGYVYLVTEDYWAEYATFVSWAMTCCFFTWMLIKNRGARKPAFVLFAFGALFVAMEEISWGQRLVGLNSPTWFVKHNLQQETSLHNFFPSSWEKYVVAGMAMVLWSILLPLMAKKWDRLRIWCNKLGIPIISVDLWPLFFLAIFFLMIDRMGTISEVAELFLAFAILALSLDLTLKWRRGTRIRGISSTVAMVNMIVIIGALTGYLVHFYSRPEGIKHKLNWFAVRGFTSVGMYRQAEILFDYMNQRPEFLKAETHFEQGVLLKQIGKHTKAKQILELTLAEQKQLAQRTPGAPAPYRVAGEVLKLLGRQEEGRTEFLYALEKDRARLEQAEDARAEAEIRWSLAMTLLAMGDFRGASEQVSVARAIVPDRMTRYRIDLWAQRYLKHV